MQNSSNIESNVYVSTVALLSSVWFTQKISALHLSAFLQNSLIVACFTFGRLKIQILTPNRFKNQTNDKFKLLGHNYDHLQGFVRQEK